jgi:hypothetical protein
MRKTCITTLALLVVAAGSASAQTTESATVTATVQATLEIAVEGTTDFGTVLPGGWVTLNVGEPAAGQTFAQFVILGSPNAQVDVGFGGCGNLTHSDGSTTMQFQHKFAGRANDGSAWSYFGFCAGEAFPVLSETGAYYFGLGGSINVMTGQKAGQYTGLQSLTVAYSGS